MKILLAFDLMFLCINLSVEKIIDNKGENQRIKREKIFFQNHHEESKSLFRLLTYVGNLYFQDCKTTIVLYDEFFEKKYQIELKELFINLPFAHFQKSVNTSHIEKKSKKFINELETCCNYVLFLKNLNTISSIKERESIRKVIVVSDVLSWTVFDFLKSSVAKLYTNLLIIAPTMSTTFEEKSFVLYTQKLYSDGIGSSRPVILTSWIKNSLARPEVNLFPPKLKDGFNGHRFRISATHKPPFAIRRVVPASDQIQWDGIDIRLIRLISKVFNFTIEVRDPSSGNTLGPTKAVTREISLGKASIALGSLYNTMELMTEFDTTFPHAYDCASFISLASTALPRYRAVLGPFRPAVWISLIFAYFGAIIPLTLNSKNNLTAIIKRPKELIEMFWYVFSTFTNCFTIRSPLVYQGMGKNATGILMGLYWVFTIIITSCYTSSIIAFITIPVYPTAMDTSNQLLYYRYRIGTLNHDGWESFFNNSDDKRMEKLFKNVDLVPTVGEGIKNASRAYFWPYAFLGSKALLEYIVQADFTPSWKTKRSLMHISRECFVQFGVTLAFSKGSMYTESISRVTQRVYQAGLLQKITSDVKWDVQRSSSGKLLQVNSEGTLHLPSADERQLTLADVQGMFMVLGAGILISLFALIMEYATQKISKRCAKVSSETYGESNSHSTWNYLEDYPANYETINYVMRHPRNSI